MHKDRFALAFSVTPVIMPFATIEVYNIPFFGEHGFWMTGLLNLLLMGNTPHLFCMILVVCHVVPSPRPWYFSSGSSFNDK